MKKQNTTESRKPAYSAVNARPAGVALHSHNHVVKTALSAWR